jgi:hypothetical protein
MTEAASPERPIESLVDDRTSKLLREFGFDPGIPVHDHVQVDFDIAQLKAALFDSDYSNPVTLPFLGQHADSTTPTDIDIRMVVESVRASYETYETEVDGIGVNRYESPEYYVRGYLYQSGCHRAAVPMHVYLRVRGRNEFSAATIQVVFQPSGADPSTPIKYAERGFGQSSCEGPQQRLDPDDASA